MENISVAICEDEEKILYYLHKQLSFHLSLNNYTFSFQCFHDGKELLNSILSGNSFQIIFLDIEMPEINGIEVCRKIRSLNYETLIIFVSNKEELVFQTFEVQPFRFLRKNHFMEELPSLIKSIQKELSRKRGIYITIEELHSRSVYSININDILYIEVIGKFCRIVTCKKELKIQYKLSDLEIQLSEYGFLQPHRSYLVNYRYIYSIDNSSLLLDDHTSIPLSRKRIKDIKTQFINFTRSE